MIPTLAFGRTGHQSTRTIFGAAAFWDTPQKDVDATMEMILQYGINHVDTAASYGRSQELLGNWIQRNGHPFFLATKTEKRTKQAAYDEIRRSLELLHVDKVDLIQLHALHEENDWVTAFGSGGVIETVIQAREEGLVKFIGITGHGVPVPEYHLRSLAQFDFDSVLLPYNFVMMQNSHYAENFNKLLELCKERNVAVQTIKGVTRSPWNNIQQIVQHGIVHLKSKQILISQFIGCSDILKFFSTQLGIFICFQKFWILPNASHLAQATNKCKS